MISNFSRYLATQLAHKTNLEDKVDYLRYGLELIIGYILKISILFLIASYLNILLPTLVLCLTFVCMRIVTGGTHLKTYISCFIFSLACFLLLAYSTRYFSLIHISTALLVFKFNIATLIGLVICYKFVPVKMVSIEESIKIRNRSFITLLIWSLLINLSIFYGVRIDLLFSSLFGLYLQLFSITTLGKEGMNRLNNFIIERRAL